MGKPQLVESESLLTSGNTTSFDYKSIDEAFPKADPGIEPFGTTCLFQIRHPKRKTSGGIILTDDARSTEYYNTQVAKVIAVGPLCFKSIKEGSDEPTPWAEGPWFKAGDFVRLPKYGGDRFTVPYSYEDFEVDGAGHKHTLTRKGDLVFALFKAKDVLGKITGDPLRIRAFLD